MLVVLLSKEIDKPMMRLIKLREEKNNKMKDRTLEKIKNNTRIL